MKEILNGRFSIKEVISENRLYKTVDIATGNLAAVKRWEGESDLFKTELQTLNSLQHPCMPHIICSFEENGYKYIAREWIDGEPLTNSNTLSLSINLVESATQFIKFISSSPHELIHGDIKPSNLLLRDNKIYFIDFESMTNMDKKFFNYKAETFSLEEKVFAAPEILQGKPCRQSDIYSLGMLLAWLNGGVNDTGLCLSSLAVDSKIKSIIKKCTAAKISDRFSCAEELLTALKDVQESKTTDIVIEEQKIITNFTIFVDCNVCFGWELANAAATYFGMKTGIFALTERTQRKLHYYASGSYAYEDEMVHEDTLPYVLEVLPIFKYSQEDWVSKGLINKVLLQNGKIYCSSSKLIGEISPEKEACIYDFNKWAKNNLDITIFVTDRYDDKPIINNLSLYSDCIVATPLADVDDIDACRNYYEKFGSNVLYVAWEFNERSSLPEESIKMIVGFDKYLGYISHSDERSYKKNFVGKIQPIFGEDMKKLDLQYVNVINRIFSHISDNTERPYMQNIEVIT